MKDPATLLLQGFDAQVYLRALITVVKIHGIEPVERDYVEARARVLGVDPAPLWAEEERELPPIPEDVGELTRRAIVRDCIMMGCIDGEYSDQERARVHEIATWLGVTEETCDHLEDWLRRYFELMDEQEALLSGFDPPVGEPPEG